MNAKPTTKLLDIERAKMSMSSRDYEVIRAKKEELDLKNTQLLNENTRLRKINVNLQNCVVTLDKKLNEKMAIFEKLGLDEDETYHKYNPYSITSQLTLRKQRQKWVSFCWSVDWSLDFCSTVPMLLELALWMTAFSWYPTWTKIYKKM